MTVKPAVKTALERGELLKLDLGGGRNPRAGYFSVDLRDSDQTDIVADLSYPLEQIPDRSVAAIYSRHALEHIANILVTMQEIRRICVPDATIEILVPHFSNVYGCSDPTHVRFFGIYSMYYFCAAENQPHRKVPSYDDGFQVESLQLCFYRYTLIDRLANRVLSPILNRSFALQNFYERRLSHVFHAWQIYFVLKIAK